MVLKNLLSLAKIYARSRVSVNLWLKLSRIKQKATNFNAPKPCIGQAKELDYFIIRRKPPGAGLFSNINFVLQGILKAESLSMKPIVDMQNYWTEYSQPMKFIGTYNAWEYFFEQTTLCNLKKVYRTNNYFLSPSERILTNHWLAKKDLSFVNDRDKILEINALYRKYIILNQFTLNLINKIKEELDWSEKDTLGLFYRGGDYLKINPKGHPKQPSLNHFIECAKKGIELANPEYIFIATQDPRDRATIENLRPKNFYQNFRSYENLARFFPKTRWLNYKTNPKLIDTYGYLVETYLLSECKFMTGTLANGSATAILINGAKYENLEIISDGTY